MKMNSILSFSFKLFYPIISNLWIFFRVNITGSRYTSDLLPKLKIKVSSICYRLCLNYTISDLSVNQKCSVETLETFGYVYLGFLM